jgi:hypothetical protein
MANDSVKDRAGMKRAINSLRAANNWTERAHVAPGQEITLEEIRADPEAKKQFYFEYEKFKAVLDPYRGQNNHHPASPAKTPVRRRRNRKTPGKAKGSSSRKSNNDRSHNKALGRSGSTFRGVVRLCACIYVYVYVYVCM